MTSLTAYKLCKILNKVGLPKGVVNMVFGNGITAAQPLCQSPRTPLISFTGSTFVGKLISKNASDQLKKVSLELGGKNAAIIFNDADLEKAAVTTVRSCFANQGEICLCTERVYVQRGVYAEFLEKLKENVRKMYPLGDPSDPATKFGALNSKIQTYLKKKIFYFSCFL